MEMGPAMKSARMQGFSLLELLIVIAIVILLMAMMISGIIRAREQAKLVEAQSNIADIISAANSYSNTFGEYPPDTGNFATGSKPDFSIDPDSIYKYLGCKVTDKTGRSLGPL